MRHSLMELELGSIGNNLGLHTINDVIDITRKEIQIFVFSVSLPLLT